MALLSLTHGSLLFVFHWRAVKVCFTWPGLNPTPEREKSTC